MGNFREKFARFMQGRYGIDQLHYALIGLYFLLLAVNAFIPSNIFGILMWVILILMFYRTFSRNIYKRRQENERFLNVWKPLKAKGALTIRRIKEIKTHRFRKCPHCQKVLRLPRKTGKHTVECPSCHKDFELRILW